MENRIKHIFLYCSIIFLFLLISRYVYVRNIVMQYGDSSFVAQILYQFRYGLKMNSSIIDSIAQAYTTIWYRPAADVCSNTLVVPTDQNSIPHLYLIAYILLPFARIIEIQTLLALLHTASYVVPVIVLMAFARKKGLSWVETGLLGILIIQHPLWGEGLRGQFYFNRLFLPFFSLIVYEVHSKKARPFVLLLFTLLALSTNEIYGIVLAFFFVISYVFFQKREKMYLLFAAGSLLYSCFAILFIQQTFHRASTQTGVFSEVISMGIMGLATYFIKMIFTTGTMKLFLANIVSFGALLFLKPKYCLFALIFFIPNILISVGGAEKVGWSTHYHIGYFISLIWLSIEAYASQRTKPIARIVLIGVLLASMMFQYDAFRMQLKPSRLEVVRIAKQMRQFFKDEAKILSYKRMLVSSIPMNSVITAPEAAMYNLYERKMYLYPMGLDTADVVILRYYPENPEGERIASINYGHQDEMLDACIFERMKKNGFKMEKGVVIGNWIVITKQY